MIFEAETIQVKELPGEIAEICFCANNSVNKLDLNTLNALDRSIQVLEQKTDLRGVILSSDKDSFIVGADITEFLGLFAKPKAELDQWLRLINTMLSRLEDLPVPTVSVIKGHALGGGCETILATDFRLADHTANIGLPETKLGIIPGFGGTVRLPRVVGADVAMELIATGATKTSADLLKIGLIDAIVDTNQIMASALRLIEDAQSGKIDWKERRSRKLSPLRLSKLESLMSFTTAKGMIAQKAGPHYPAPITAVKAIESAASKSRDEALDIERNHFIELTQTEVATSLIGLFLNDQHIKGLAKQSTRASNKPTHRAGVLGAGIMGGGIAYQSALKGIPVLMKDIAQESLDLGLAEAAKHLNSRVARGRMKPEKLSRVLSSITPSLHYAGIEQVDVVIEAVVENPTIKSAVLSEVEQQVDPETVITSNTSTIPINLLAHSLKRPDKFCGMHFFNPVHRMPLVEIIRGEHTSEETINRVVAYAAAMGKSPIVVNDCPGFFVNRVLFPYLIGFSHLLSDGADFQRIDKIMERGFGWPMGPAYLLDVVGIDTAHHAQEVMAQGYPQRMAKQGTDALDLMYQHQRFGQKNGIGFYRYEPDKKGKPKKIPDSVTSEILKALNAPQKEFTDSELQDRMMIPMINEVILCLEEGIIASPQEADMALIYGLGFPPFRGGVFRYLNSIGINNYLAMCEQHQHLGPLYQAPQLLHSMAQAGEEFYTDQHATNV